MLSIATLRLCALTVASALMLAAVPHEALAKDKDDRPRACRKFGLKAGCVINKDIKPDSLSAADFEDAEGANFKTKPSATKDVDHISREYAKVVLKVPAPGVVIVNASAFIEADDDEWGIVACRLTEGGTSVLGPAFSGTVNTNGKPNALFPEPINLKYDTLFMTYGFEVFSKGIYSIAMRCAAGGILFGSLRGPLGLGAASLTAQYYSTKY